MKYLIITISFISLILSQEKKDDNWISVAGKSEKQVMRIIFKEIEKQKAKGAPFVEREKDITLNIIRALKLLTPYRKRQIKEHVPSFIQSVFESYAGVTGGSVNKAFLEGNLVYKSATLRIDKG